MTKERILEAMSRPTFRAATAEDVSRMLRITPQEAQKQLTALVYRGQLTKSPSGRYDLKRKLVPDACDEKNVKEATISIIKSGVGFAKLVDNEEFEYFVDKNNTGGALNGDRVKVCPVLEKRDGGDMPGGRVVAVVERAKDFFVGTIVDLIGELGFAPDDQRMSYLVKLDGFKNVVVGSKVLVRIASFEGEVARGTIARVLGHVNDPGVDILSVILENGIKPEFEQKTIEEVDAIEFKITEADRAMRKDLSQVPIVTIDPWDAKDLDDAVCVKANADGTYALSVSIADVSWFVRFGKPLDEEAVERGTSVYLTDRVVPMLPHKLSNDICSLNQDVERFTLTCDIVINEDGTYKSYDVYPSIIKSWRRFAYDEVNDYYGGKTDFANERPEVKKSLDDARRLHRILRQARQKAGYIDFEIKEAKVIVDDQGVATDVVVRERGEAQMMIESFMIAANEAVVLRMNDLKHPLIYRVHDVPNGDKLKSLAPLAAKMGFAMRGPFERVKPKDVAAWLDGQRDNANYPLVAKMLLRAMAKAKYSTKNIGHFGLASENYTHFTSPIRRYPDLLVHRMYWATVFDQSFLNEKDRRSFTGQLSQLAEQSSQRELAALACEREVNSMKFAEYMGKHIDEVFEGRVTSVVSFGVWVELPNTIEGLLAARNIGDDFYVHNEKEMTLTGQRKRRVITIGTKMMVRVISANKAERRVEFALEKFL